MRPIGGYFELELAHGKHFPHQEGALLNSGRCALEYLLKGIGEVRHLYIPYYTCDVVLEPLQRLGINHDFYHVGTDLEIAEMPDINDGDYILANNYFGIKDQYIKDLCHKFAGHIIIDNSQALFTPQYNGQPTFWSPRKFVGVPDGGIAKPRYDINVDTKDVSFDRCSHLLKRIDVGATAGYGDFHINSEQLKRQQIKRMSALTETLLGSIDYDRVVERRKNNYTILREALEGSNLLTTPAADEIVCPMVYPFYTDDPDMRSRLIKQQIFVAKYWPNVAEWTIQNDIERKIAECLLPIPIDQRYSQADMEYILSIISER